MGSLLKEETPPGLVESEPVSDFGLRHLQRWRRVGYRGTKREMSSLLSSAAAEQARHLGYYEA